MKDQEQEIFEISISSGIFPLSPQDKLDMGHFGATRQCIGAKEHHLLEPQF